ncbi:hypothetical protein G7067_05530 [Leucobacter insecticola]|uniref:Septum formation-related domain-containing protein n=1 Tax=Leucobacter insecticola TaxID=2714934 RepID=A0A6G8FHR9_9MICO|nr:septum formation family protein [Leucobacter insecticola]QIM16000.1 hypothetical protein G7067_05530 [Leucobacter insecticola]
MSSRSIRLVAAPILAAALAFSMSSCSVLDSVFGTPSAPVRDSQTGEITEGNDKADVFALRVGDCMNESTGSTEVSSVPTVPCAEAHDEEIYHSFMMKDGDFPGDSAITAESEKVCTPEFESFIGISYDESTLDWYPFTPTAGSWGEGDREVLCVAWDPAGKVTGSLKGAAR